MKNGECKMPESISRCKFAMTRYFALILCILLFCGVSSWAQEPAEKAKAPPDPAAKTDEPAKTPAEQFKTVHGEWNALDKRLSELQASYATAAPAAREEIKKQYTELVTRSTEMLPELRAAAEAAYVAEPNKDPEVTTTLIGLVAYDLRRDEYESALKLTKVLEDKKCEEAVLFGVAGQAAYSSDDYDTAEKYLTIASKAGKLDEEGQKMLADLPEQKKAWAAEKAIRDKEAAADDLPRVKLETSKGNIVIELLENEAPQAVANFVSLVEKKFYDGLTFHRVLPNFMAQGGDPTGTGSGGPGYNIFCECYQENARKHFRGTLSMAHAGRDTGGSQFFLTFRPTTYLNGRHTVFGRVIEGHDVLAKLQRVNPQAANQPQPDKIVKAEVVRKRPHAYEPKKVPE
jgi:cyclophilin family peptidyl-prolyl cis-trans isomerase